MLKNLKINIYERDKFYECFLEYYSGLGTKEYGIYVEKLTNRIIEATTIQYGEWLDLSDMDEEEQKMVLDLLFAKMKELGYIE